MTSSLKKKLLLSLNRPIRPQDFFATSLYTGNGGTQTITNGLDLAGKGGLTWFKKRSSAQDHFLLDSARGLIFGFSPFLASNSTNPEASPDAGFVFPRSAGTLEIGDAAKDLLSAQGASYVNWSFRRAKKFLDIVTYTGNGQSGRQIPHGLGDVPGMIIAKGRSFSDSWWVYHRTLGGMSGLKLNTTEASAAYTVWGFTNTGVNSSYFTVDNALNMSGQTYVAYLFAHNPDLIDCGSYVGNGLDNGPAVTCGKGWPPQFILLKRTSAGGNGWFLFDTARSPSNPRTATLSPNTSGAEQNDTFRAVNTTATGFKLAAPNSDVNFADSTYVYLAIRSPT